MTKLLPFVLAFVSVPAFAALNMSIEGIVEVFLYLLVAALIFGILIFLLRRAPFIPAEWKVWIEYILYFLAALVVINLLLGFLGHPLVAMK